MKRILIIFVLTAVCHFTFAQIDRTKIPKAGPAPEINIGTPTTFELDNGLKVIVVENNKLPRVTFNLVLDFEAVKEGGKAGYAAMAGDLMRTGTTTKSKAEIDEAADFIGGTLNTSASGIYAAALTKHQDALLALMTDVLLNPTFPAEELEKLKKQTLSALASQKDEPAAIAANVRSVVLYGKDHPYGELTTEETVENITLEDCRDYYQKYYSPKIAYLAIVGDISAKDAKKLVNKYFGMWQGSAPVLPEFPSVTAPSSTKVALVNRSNSVQSEIRVAYPIDLKKGDEDVIKANLMNTILGAGFSSRIMQNLREKHAYTYGAGSSLSSDMIVGNFTANTSVRNEVTDSAIYQIFYELNKIISEKATEQELASAKAYVSGGFARAMESPQTIANFALNISRYKLPVDYYTNYLKKVEAVTLEDVQAMAKKYIKPENAHIVVVGKGSEISPMLTQFGEVTNYDIYGNKVEPLETKLPEGLTSDQVLDGFLAAIGGESKARTVKDITLVMKTEMQGRELEIAMISKDPNMTKTSVSMGGMPMMTSVFDGKDVKIEQMGQPVPVDEEQKKDMPFEAAIIAELYVKDHQLATTLTGIENLEGTQAYAVEITKPSGNKTTYYYDVNTGLKLRTSTTLQSPQGTMVQDTDLSDYREVNGVKFPYAYVLPMGPMKMNATADRIETNTGVADGEFEIK
ncbi:MAG: insulinase family protein [Cyclobacteriaceae bacterium]|nr:insulinase family protein [Cyclobacteriaceae bacterium]